MLRISTRQLKKGQHTLLEIASLIVLALNTMAVIFNTIVNLFAKRK